MDFQRAEYDNERIVHCLRCAEPINVVVLDSVDSTNSYAKRMITSLKMDKTALILAGTQTDGRGRLGRSFYSPPESGIYMTLCYRTNSALSDVVSITTSASVAVMRSLKKLTGKQTDIKWVNDLYYNQKKVCGILAEAVPDSEHAGYTYVIVGIGINLYKAEFPSELSGIAGTLDANCDKNQLVSDVASNLLLFAATPDDRSYMTEYRQNSIVIGKDVICRKGNDSFAGKAKSITDDGALVVLKDDGSSVTLDSGEVSLRFI